MSRRAGNSRAAAAAAANTNEEEEHQSLEGADADPTDPVISAIRYGMRTILRIAKETIPYARKEDNMRDSIMEKMDVSLLELVESEMTYLQTQAIVNQVVEEMNIQDNPGLQTKEFLESVESINDLTDERLGEYKQSLTEEILKSHPMYIKINSELNALSERADGNNDEDEEEEDDDGGANVGEDADTEPDEVDLDESVLNDDD